MKFVDDDDHHHYQFVCRVICSAYRCILFMLSLLLHCLPGDVDSVVCQVAECITIVLSSRPTLSGLVPDVTWVYFGAAVPPYSLLTMWYKTEQFDFLLWLLRRMLVLTDIFQMSARHVSSGFGSWDVFIARWTLSLKDISPRLCHIARRLL